MHQESLSFKALELYGTRMRHPGQWLVHSHLRKILGVDQVNAYVQVERGGFRWVLNPFDYVQQSLFWLGEHDRWEVSHIKRMLPQGAIVFDVGANFGYYSLTIAESIRPYGHVYSFEPHPDTRARLRKHIALNHLGEIATVVPCALSDEPGALSMSWSEHNTGAAHLSADGEVQVEVTTLDNFCSTRQLSRLDFVKIDVEGFEPRVLRGGEHSLRKFRPTLFVEMLPTQLERTGSSAAELAYILRDLGYSLHVCQRKQLVPLTNLPGQSELINVFCLPVGDMHSN